MAALTPNRDRARAAWGAALPDWIATLADACDRSSQGRIAERLEISAAVVNQLIGASYKGRLDRMEARVRGEFLDARVSCPVLGEIPTGECIGHQLRKFQPTNPLRVALRRACPTCPNREDACSKP